MNSSTTNASVELIPGMDKLLNYMKEQDKKIKELQDENKKLKEDNEEILNIIESHEHANTNLGKENKKLKEESEEMEWVKQEGRDEKEAEYDKLAFVIGGQYEPNNPSLMICSIELMKQKYKNEQLQEESEEMEYCNGVCCERSPKHGMSWWKSYGFNSPCKCAYTIKRQEENKKLEEENKKLKQENKDQIDDAVENHFADLKLRETTHKEWDTLEEENKKLKEVITKNYQKQINMTLMGVEAATNQEQ